MNYLKKISLYCLLAAGITGVSPAIAQDENIENPEEAGVVQQATTLRNDNIILSRKIAYVYKQLESYSQLYNCYNPDSKYFDCSNPGKKLDEEQETWRKITLSPRQTLINFIRETGGKPDTKGKVVGIKIEQYDFVYPPARFGVHEPSGSKSKSISLYFEGNKLTKVVSAMEENNFEANTTKVDIVTDESPVTSFDPNFLKYVPYGKDQEKVEKIDDIKFKHIYTHGQTYEKIIADMKLTVTNPHRIIFKRDFYIKHLVNFENLLRLTDDYQRFKRDGKDKDVTAELVESLDY